ncbi:MAG: coiled-coil domain-containing protein, partial [Candidatus Bathyarchaeia archaeon]
MREIPVEKRMEVLKLYFIGYSYDKIVEVAGVAKGSVVNIVKELKEGRYPEFESILDLVDELRSLAVEIKRSGLGISQASLGIKFYERIKRLTEPQTLDGYIKMCERISPPNFPIDKFIDVAIRLHELEEKVGKNYEEALKDIERELEEKSSNLRGLSSQVEVLERKRARLKDELKKMEAELTSARFKLGELIKGVESLERLGVEKVCKLSTFVRECEELGYSADRLKELIKLVNERAALEKQKAILLGKLATLNEEVKRAEREKLARVEEDKRLSVVSGILKTRITCMACLSCGRTIFLPVPTIRELGDAMKRGLVYPTRCHYCGYINQISP